MTARDLRGAARRWGAWFVGGAAAGALAGAAVFAVGVGQGASGAESGGAPDPPPAQFVEETASSGVTHIYDGGFEHFVGGGIAVLDCDDDQRPDLYLAGGENAAALYRNDSRVGGPLSFAPVPDPAAGMTGVVGAYPLDVDADGTLDLAVLRVGENVLLRGLGGCRFERANEAWGVDGGDAWTAAFSATWESETGAPTLAFGTYLGEPDAQNARSCEPSVLIRPSGPGPQYAEPVSLEPALCTLSVLFSDWDRTGRSDLRVTNDQHYYREGGEQLWLVEPGEPPRLYTEADGWDSFSIWGMGIAERDVTGDGLPEVVLTSQADNKLQTLDGQTGRPSYTDIAIRAGTTAHRPFMGQTRNPSTAWHPEFADVNNDGHDDLFLSKGNVDSQIDHAADDPSNLLLARGDGTFVESARHAGVVSLGKGRGAALVDANLDGMVDLVEVNRGDAVRLWRNVGGGDATRPEPMGQWVALRLQQDGPNRDAVGSWLEVRAGDGVRARQLTVGGGHAGGQLGWTHVGLGQAQRADVRVQWPDGEWSDWTTVEADQFVVLERGADQPRTWAPAAVSGG